MNQRRPTGQDTHAQQVQRGHNLAQLPTKVAGHQRGLLEQPGVMVDMGGGVGVDYHSTDIVRRGGCDHGNDDDKIRIKAGI